MDEFDQEIRIENLENEVEKVKTDIILLRRDVDAMKITMGSFKEQMAELGKYATRTRDELLIMKGQVFAMVRTLETALSNMKSTDPDYSNTTATLRQARNNYGRIEKAISNIPVVQ